MFAIALSHIHSFTSRKKQLISFTGKQFCSPTSLSTDPPSTDKRLTTTSFRYAGARREAKRKPIKFNQCFVQNIPFSEHQSIIDLQIYQISQLKFIFHIISLSKNCEFHFCSQQISHKSIRINFSHVHTTIFSIRLKFSIQANKFLSFSHQGLKFSS